MSPTERHRVVDFQFDPDLIVAWAVLDSDPSDAWVAGLDRALDDEVRRVRPVYADGDRVYLRVRDVDEFDALTLLAAYVAAANDAFASRGDPGVRAPRRGR